MKGITTLKGNSKKVLLPNKISSNHTTSFKKYIYEVKVIKLNTKVEKEDLKTLCQNYKIYA